MYIYYLSNPLAGTKDYQFGNINICIQIFFVCYVLYLFRIDNSLPYATELCRGKRHAQDFLSKIEIVINNGGDLSRKWKC